MKSILFTILIFITSLTFSQTSDTPDSKVAFGQFLQSLSHTSGGMSEVGAFYNKPKKIVGNIYVFENWDNVCKIVIGEEIYKFKHEN